MQIKNTYYSAPVTVKNKLCYALSDWFITSQYILPPVLKLVCDKILRFYTLVSPVYTEVTAQVKENQTKLPVIRP